MAEFEKLLWAEAKKCIPDLTPSFVAACDVVAKRLKGKAFVYHVRYRYGEEIVGANGFNLPAEDTNGDAIAGLDRCIPFSIVKTCQVEVFLPGAIESNSDRKNWPRGYLMDRPRTVRILGPGEMFGAFESTDRCLGSGNSVEGGWHISAGSRSARLIYPLKSAPALDSLSDEFGSLIEEKLPGPLDLWRWSLMKAICHDSEWRAEVLVFPNQWENGSTKNQLHRSIFQTAWEQIKVDNLSKIREDLIRSLLCKELRPLLEIHKDPAFAFELLLVLDGVGGKRIPAYCVPPDDDAQFSHGPFQQIVKKLTDTIGNSQIRRSSSTGEPSWPLVLVPKYLSNNDVGMLSFRYHPFGSRPDMNANVTREIGKVLSENADVLQVCFPSLDWNSVRLAIPKQAASSPHCIEKVTPDMLGLRNHGRWMGDDSRSESMFGIDNTHPFMVNCVMLRTT